MNTKAFIALLVIGFAVLLTNSSLHAGPRVAVYLGGNGSANNCRPVYYRPSPVIYNPVPVCRPRPVIYTSYPAYPSYYLGPSTVTLTTTTTTTTQNADGSTTRTVTTSSNASPVAVPPPVLINRPVSVSEGVTFSKIR